MLKEIGINIKNARKEAKLTQQELAEKVGILREQISYIETGQREIKVSMLNEIAKACNVTMQNLLTKEKSPSLDIKACSIDENVY